MDTSQPSHPVSTDVGVAERALLGLLALGAMAIQWPALTRGVFRDEAATYFSAHEGWGALASQTRVQDLVLLPYYVVMHVWVLASSSVLWLRMPSLLAFGVAIYVLGLLGYRLGGRGAGLIAAVVAATNPLFDEASTFARPYALASATAVTAAYTLVRWSEQRRPSQLWWWAALTVGTAAWNAFAASAPLMVAVVWFLTSGRLRERRAAVAPFVVALAVPIMWLAVTSSQVGQVSWIRFGGVRSAITDTLAALVTGGHRYADLVSLAIVMALCTLAVAWRRGRFSPDRNVVAAGAAGVTWAFGPSALLVAVSFVHPLFAPRYATVTAPGLAILVGVLVATAIRQGTHLVTPVLVGVVSGVVLVGYVVVLWPGVSQAQRFYTEAGPTVARYLASHATTTSEVALPYHLIAAEVIPAWPREQAAPRLWPTRSQPSLTNSDLVTSTAVVNAAASTVWIVYELTSPPQSVASVVRFEHTIAAAGYHLIATSYFSQIVVARFQRT